MTSRWWVPVLLIALAGAAGCRMPGAAGPTAAPPCPDPARPCRPVCRFAPADEQFLDDLERRIFQYFWNEVYPETGIAIDHTENRMGKVAATGFELAAICIGIRRGWVSYDDGYARVMTILNAFYDDPDDPGDPYVEGHFGLFWHFVDGVTGKKIPIDCVAPCDSADFIAGAVLASEFFRGTPAGDLARKLYDNAQWDQFVTRLPNGQPGLMSFGWVPLNVSETYPDTDGLLNFNMSGLVDNSLLIYVLGLGSDTFPIPVETWDEYVNTYTLGEYSGYECVLAGALFCRQVPHAFIRFSRKQDRKIDYFLDTVNALLADRAFNLRVNGYPPPLFGLTDCFGKDTYSHAAPPGPVMNDGTVGSTAFGGALPHIPGAALDAMKYVRREFGGRAWGRYGFTSSVNRRNDFVSPLYVGIEQGPLMMLIENARTGFIWDLFSASRVMSNFVRRARMTGIVDDFELPPEAPAYADWAVDGGAVVLTDDQPRHGRRCLALIPSAPALTVTASLPANDLLDFHYGTYLSLWTRDLDIAACRILLDGREQPCGAAGKVGGAGWTHHYFALPPRSATSELCAVTFGVAASGPRPALDRILLEADADLGAPQAVQGLKAATGAAGGSVRLSWIAPADTGSDRVNAYEVQAVEAGDPENPRTIELAAVRKAGETEERTVLLERDRPYRIRIAAVDEHGHRGPVSEPVDVRSSAAPIESVAYDFEDGSLEGVENVNSNWTVTIAENGDGTRSLKVDWSKSHAWNPLFFEVDPARIALNRFLRVRVRGEVTLLGKLWCAEDLQQDMEPLASESADSWTPLTYDTTRASMIRPDRDPVRKLILFPAPGLWSGNGTFYVDEIRYSNKEADNR